MILGKQDDVASDLPSRRRARPLVDYVASIVAFSVVSSEAKYSISIL
jgi:hypothetical protein